MGKKLFALFFLLASVCSFASLTLHIQSPWRDDATKAGYVPHITGGTTNYNAEFGSSSKTIMIDEGNGWFSYTWSKDVSAFQDWDNFEIAIYPNTSDNSYNSSHGEKWAEAGKVNIVSFFGVEKELWLYTNTKDMSYTVSFVAPGSKMVWFKSPWGNKAVPDMILGRDTVMMRFQMDDKSKCGWFYGALSPEVMKRNPLQSAYFIRHLTPYMAVPEKGLVELRTYLASHDSIFVDGTVATPKITETIGTLGTCFDSTRVLHVQHPWRSNTSYRDRDIYIKVDGGVKNGRTNLGTYTAMSNKGEYPYWYRYSFNPATVASAEWNSSSARVNIRRYGNWPEVAYFADNQRPLASSLFPQGVYETWLYTGSNGKLDIVFTPQEPKVIRLMSPWDDMTPSMIVESDTVKMAPVGINKYTTGQTDTCGWYTVTYYKHVEKWDVHFKQTFGYDNYSREGTMGEGMGLGTPISLDSMLALYDTVWVYPYPLSNSSPKFSEKFPGRLGVCPTMKISAMVVDWAGESYPDSIDVDFGGISSGNAYTTVTYKNSAGKLVTGKTCGSAKGMVQSTLVNGNPARVDSALYPWDKCTAAHEIERWFVPEVVATDKRGKKYTNAVCRDIDLKLDEEGFWLADITNNQGNCNDPVNPGFFPIDDLEYLDSAKTVKNPKFDWGASGCKHNYSFAMKISAQFKYVKGQYFEFRGDDDVWVFINNRLVVDIGGCHNPEEGAVNLDTLGLTEGEEYPFHIFFSERQVTGSNFKMRTSINLQTRKTYFSEKKKRSDKIIEYDLKQLLVDESLSCDVSAGTKTDTAYAQSIFRLKGGNLPMDGVLLNPGINYGGINISANMSSFTIDTSAFVNSRALSPGKYMLYCHLASDPNQWQVIVFVVPEYPLPNIGFIDVFHLSESPLLDPKGITLNGDSLGANGGANDTLWAYAVYPDTIPLQVALLFGQTPCGKVQSEGKINCKEKLVFKTKFPISFLDEKFQLIDTLVTDSMGYAKFYVSGDTAMVNASFSIWGTGVANELVWKEIHFKEPPVPIVRKSQMFDVDGNGIPDSLVMYFSKHFEDVVPDTLKWVFGGDEEHKVSGMNTIWPLVKKDSILVLYDKKGLRKDIFTGLADKVYAGSLNYHYTYIDKDSGEEVKLMLRTSIEDKVAPVIQSAVVQTVTKNSSMVVINLSEGSDIEKVNPESTFVFFRGVRNFMDSLRIAGADIRGERNMVQVYFQRSETGVLPMVGDSVRLVPGVFGDRSGNKAHLLNPKVRIVGQQRTEIQSPGVITIPKDPEKWPYKEPIVALAVPADMTIRDVIDSLGMPGFLLSYDLGELATTVLASLPEGADKDSALAEIKIKWEGHYFSHLGSFVNRVSGTIRCNDSTVYYNALNPAKSNCIDNPGNIFFEWSARSENGRLVGTGPYIYKLRVKVYNGKSVEGKNEDVYTLGIRRGK
ncbi:MAG: fibro-slime domain-containing protein [Fibrobacter sp.]|nr:fibro-slime domain-containing protein [Fibrobacter sp.]